jgi:hypothetical protein
MNWHKGVGVRSGHGGSAAFWNGAPPSLPFSVSLFPSVGAPKTFFSTSVAGLWLQHDKGEGSDRRCDRAMVPDLERSRIFKCTQ